MSIRCLYCGKTVKSEEDECPHEEVEVVTKVHKVVITRGKDKGKGKLIFDVSDFEEAVLAKAKELGLAGISTWGNSGPVGRKV